MPPPTAPGFFVLSHPYTDYQPYHPDMFTCGPGPMRGIALVWLMSGRGVAHEIELADARPGGVALVVVLPEASQLKRSDCGLLNAVEATRPHSVLPYHLIRDPQEVSSLLRQPPDRFPEEFVDFLLWRGLQLDKETRRIVRRTVELARHISTLEALSRNIYLSRRALGRRFYRSGLPVPSHWLQVARLLWACIKLQSCEAPLSQLARTFHYPDAFTLSNQMERMIGVRPSLVRERFGWEWLVEEWLRTEWGRDGLRVPLRGIDPIRQE